MDDILPKFKRHPAILFAVILGTLQLVAMLTMGFHFGWLDDVLFELNARGTLSNYHNGDALIYWKGFSVLFGWLYDWRPEIPWYGILHLFFLVLIQVNIILFLSRIIAQDIRPAMGALIATLLYSGLMLPYFIAPTFTTTSLLLTGTSLVNLWDRRQNFSGNRVRFAYLLLAFCAGLMIRYRVAMLAIIVLLPFCLHALIQHRQHKSVIVKILAPIALTLVLLGSFSLLESRDNRAYREKISYIRPVLDGFNYGQRYAGWIDLSPRDSILMKASTDWFIEDEAIFNKDFFSTVGHLNLLHPEIRKNWRLNLLQEWQKSKRYNEDYLLHLNWGKEIRFFLVLVLLFSILPLFASPRPSLLIWMLHISKFAVFAAAVLTVAILYKMEGRVLIPLAIVFGLLYGLEALYLAAKRHMAWLTIPLVLFCTIPVLMPDYWISARNKIIEEEKNRSVVDEINNRFKDKLIVFDYYTSWLIHGGLLEYVPLSDDNQYAIWGEPGFHYFKRHREYLATICDDISFNGFFECLKERNDVILVFSEQRASLITSYARILYDLDLKMVRMDGSYAIDDLHYSFLWYPMRFSYYTLE